MRVTVHYLAQLKRAAGTSAETVDLADGSTVGDLFRSLGASHDATFRRLLLDDDRPAPSLLVFADDEPVGAAAPLHDGASVTILSPMAGGTP